MHSTSKVGGEHQVRWFVTAVAVPVAAIALAAAAYFGGQLPAKHSAPASAAHTTQASATPGR
jgi:hypothetical protein